VIPGNDDDDDDDRDPVQLAVARNETRLEKVVLAHGGHISRRPERLRDSNRTRSVRRRDVPGPGASHGRERNVATIVEELVSRAAARLSRREIQTDSNPVPCQKRSRTRVTRTRTEASLLPEVSLFRVER